MPAQDKLKISTLCLLEWIETDLILIESLITGQTNDQSTDNFEFLREEAPLALENIRACLQDLKNRISMSPTPAQTHQADARAAQI